MFVSRYRGLFFLLFLAGTANATIKDTNSNPYISTSSDTITLHDQVVRHTVQLSPQGGWVTICGLSPSETYGMFISSEGKCQPLVTSTNAKMASVQAPGSSWRLFPHANCLELFIETVSCPQLLTDWTISLGCESCQEPARPRSIVGVETDGNYSPEELIKDVFIGGDCFDVDESSITFNGNRNASGVFSNAESSIDIEAGVILSTGNIRNCEGPNERYNTGTTFFDRDFDPDLALTLGAGAPPMWDISSLEFDFTPTSDTISFDYVFASEEYCEYAGSAYNDAFGFYISGPGINGPFSNNAENIAFVPGSSDYVTINNVNHYLNDNFYVNNIPVAQHRDIPFWLECTDYPMVNGRAIDEFEFDGFTTVMRAIARVIPCETYHIKLIIADVNDGYFDSAVFLKANSFRSEGSAILSSEVPGFGDDLAYEGCVDGQFVFERINSDTSEDVTIHFNILPSSTATPDVDYAALPTEITIPAGDSVVYLPVNIFTDNLTEGIEEIILELDAPCSCSLPTTSLRIADMEPLAVALVPAAVCEGDTFRLNPNASGGIPDYRFQWSTLDSVPDITIVADITRNYSVTVTDVCGNTAINDVQIAAVERPSATLSGNEIICNGKTGADLTLALNGEGPWQVVYEFESTLLDTIFNINTTNFSFTVDQPGHYRLLQVSNGACIGPADGTAQITYDSIYLNAVTAPVTCPGRDDGSIQLTTSGGTQPFTYNWQNIPISTSQANNLSEGDYTVRITDSNGCYHDASLSVALTNTVPEAEAGEDEKLTCSITQLQLNAVASTGNEYRYEWVSADGRILSGANQLDPLIDRGGLYQLSVTHTPTNCSVSDELQVVWDTLPPTANITAQGPSSLNCNLQQTTLDGTFSQPFRILSFQWLMPNGVNSPPNGLDTLPQLEVDRPGEYRLRVKSQENGCEDEALFIVEVDTTQPRVIIDPPPTWTCRDSDLWLDASASSIGNNYQYQWTSQDGIILSGAQKLRAQIGHPTTYFLHILNQSNGCQDSAAITIPVDTLAPTANAGPEQTLDCVSLSATVNGTGSSQGPGYGYLWLTTDGHLTDDFRSITATVDQVGTYILTVTNLRNGCQAMDVVRVIENDNLPSDLTLVPFAPLCFNGDGQVQIAAVSGGIGPYLYSIDNGETFRPDTFFMTIPPGNYEVIVQDILGCEYAETVVVPNVPPIIISLEPELEIILGENTTLIAQTNLPAFRIDSIRWSPADDLSCAEDCLITTAAPVNDTRYTVTIVDTDGCRASASSLIRVDKQRNIFIPNVFSPNQDGHNDFFTVFSDRSVRSIRNLRVFSRWGEEVFFRDNFSPNREDEGWNGTFKGEELNPGVYVFVTEVEFIDGETKLYQGDVTLVK